MINDKVTASIKVKKEIKDKDSPNETDTKLNETRYQTKSKYLTKTSILKSWSKSPRELCPSPVSHTNEQSKMKIQNRNKFVELGNNEKYVGKG